MNNDVDQLKSYRLDIIPSWSYVKLPYLILFKKYLPYPSHNIHTWHHKVHIKAMHDGQFILRRISLLQITLCSYSLPYEIKMADHTTDITTI